MRCSSSIMVIVMTVMLLIAPATAQAKHNYVFNSHPTINYFHRCLGIGWSDGYHARGGWNVKQPKKQIWYSHPAAQRAWSQYPTNWTQARKYPMTKSQ